MEISLRTAKLIQIHDSDHIRCEAIQNNQDKWSGQINFWKNNELHCTLVSTNFNFDSSAEALEVMQKIIDLIRKVDAEETT